MWNDTGLAVHLQGLSRWEDAQRLGRSTFLVENRIAMELKALLSAHLPLAKLYYWRTSGGAEVDLIVEYNGRLVPIEVKWSEHVSTRDLKGLDSFFNDMGSDVSWGMVLYRGQHVVKLSEKVFLVPLERVVF